MTKTVFNFGWYLRMKIGRQLGKRREKFERKMGTLDRIKSLPGNFSESQRERDQSRRGAPRKNSWHIVLICFLRRLDGSRQIEPIVKALFSSASKLLLS